MVSHGQLVVANGTGGTRSAVSTSHDSFLWDSDTRAYLCAMNSPGKNSHLSTDGGGPCWTTQRLHETALSSFMHSSAVHRVSLVHAVHASSYARGVHGFIGDIYIHGDIAWCNAPQASERDTRTVTTVRSNGVHRQLRSRAKDERCPSPFAVDRYEPGLVIDIRM
jgi:hypothetical protein